MAGVTDTQPHDLTVLAIIGQPEEDAAFQDQAAYLAAWGGYKLQGDGRDENSRSSNRLAF